MAYQETWIRGASRQSGDRVCADRYAIIQPIVARYTRPVTVWDLGANLGYFGLRLAHDYGAVSVMVEPRPALVDVCRQNALPTTIALTHRLSVRDLQELAASEHADVVLALNLLHHFEDWVGALDAVLSLGEVAIIETPGRGDTGSASYRRSQEILDVLDARAEQIGTAPSHVTPGVQRPMFRWSRPKSAVSRGYVYGGKVRARGPHPTRPHTITSTPTQKAIRYADGESRAWVPGLNLWNWLQMGGSYPSRATVKREVARVAATVTGHGDFKPWNLILAGETVVPIDHGHRQSCTDADGLAKTLAWIDTPEAAYVA